MFEVTRRWTAFLPRFSHLPVRWLCRSMFQRYMLVLFTSPFVHERAPPLASPQVVPPLVSAAGLYCQAAPPASLPPCRRESGSIRMKVSKKAKKVKRLGRMRRPITFPLRPDLRTYQGSSVALTFPSGRRLSSPLSLGETGLLPSYPDPTRKASILPGSYRQSYRSMCFHCCPYTAGCRDV